MTSVRALDEAIATIGDPDTAYFGGSALFLLDTLRFLNLYPQIADKNLCWKHIVYGIEGFKDDPLIFKSSDKGKIARKASEYACYAKYVKTIGFKFRDRFLTHSLSALVPIVSDLAKRGGVDEDGLDLNLFIAFPIEASGPLYDFADSYSRKGKTVDFFGYELHIALALLKKMTLRRQRLKAKPPVDLDLILEKIAEVENHTAVSEYQDLLVLRKAAHRAFARTKSSARYDYRFVAQELGAIVSVS